MKKTNDFIKRRLWAVAFAVVFALSLAACGNTDTSGGSAEWVWVPEFVTIEDENFSYYEMNLVGDSIYYISYQYDEETWESYQNICKYSLTDNTVDTIPLNWTAERGTGGRNINGIAVAQDGSIYALVYAYSESPSGDYTSEYFLSKFDAEGNQLFYRSMADQLNEDPENSYVRSLVVDSQNRLYITSNSLVWLYDDEGNYQGTVRPDSSAGGWINSIGCGKDGKVYVCSYSYDGTSSGYVLTEIDFDNKKAGETYSDFPGNGNSNLIPGIEKDFLAHNGSTVYEYDLSTQTKEVLFDWLDSDINGNYVSCFSALEDGRILAVYSDWETNDRGLALLTKTKGSEVAQKETITIGTLYGGSDLQSAAVNFNKNSDKYHVTIKQYIDYDNWSETSWSDAITNLNNDLTSSNCPDIIAMYGLNTEQLVAKGVFEDLGGYLDQSSLLNRSDFLENVIEAYTFDGVLVSIPSTFVLQTVVGRASDVGTEMGWTIDELIAYADAHPDAQLFDNTTRSTLMQYLMIYNEDAFVDWSTGECSFDSDQFKKLLEFVKRFPDEVNWSEDDLSTPSKIQNGEVLLDTAYIYDFDSIQMYYEIFEGAPVCIGYPTVDGSAGCMLASGDSYAITAKSTQKDGAWEFIESILTKEDNGYYWNGFPTMKSKLDTMLADAIKVEYYTDENGELLLDENGDPIIMNSGGGVTYQDGWSYTYHIPTQEEADIILALIDVAKPVSFNFEDEILNIINEEAEAFYLGQKSVDEVAGIIQSRIKIYVSENQ